MEPFPQETEWYVPPFRTVDGDTFDALRAEVAAQEEAAGQITAAASAGPVEDAAPVRAAEREPAATGLGPQRGAETGEGMPG